MVLGLGAMAAAARVIGFLQPAPWHGELAVHFRLQYPAVLAPAALLLLVVRRPRSSVVFALFALQDREQRLIHSNDPGREAGRNFITVNSASEHLADFAAGLEYSALPTAVRVKAKRHLLDLIGVALASSAMPFGRAARDAVGETGGSCTLVGFRETASAPCAALVNGTLAHGTDFDDTHLMSVVHVSTSVVPAALACAEKNGSGGAEILTAMAIGMEVAVRVGMAAPGAFHDRGFHPTGICGVFGAALVAGRLQRLDARRLADALGLCGSFASGSLEFLSDGSSAKRVHGGWAAHGGIVAAQLAASGFSGPREVFEGRFGLYRSHLGDAECDLGALTRGLGQRWEMLDIALKPYPCCHFTHAFIDCAAALRAGGAQPAQIERIECFIAPREMPVVCDPIAAKRFPQNEYEAKFSLPYAVACMFMREHVDLDDFTEHAIRDPGVLRLSQRIECIADPDADFPRRFPGRMRVTLQGGGVLEHAVENSRGTADRPLTAMELYEKFIRNATRRLAPDQAAAIVRTIETIEDAPDVGTLAALCKGPR